MAGHSKEVDALVSEIDEFPAMIASRRSLGKEPEDLMKRLANSMAAKIGRLPGMGPNDQKMLVKLSKHVASHQALWRF